MLALKFLHSNSSYLVWFCFYFLIAWFVVGTNLNGFLIVFAVYSISIAVALSPVGEVILQITENCREPTTEQEKNYLLPMFEEVYEEAKERNPKLNKGIKIYIMDAMYVNAFAMGRKTVAVTRGAMETFTPDELKGILAHELGHIMHGHTKALLLSLIGNFFFTVIVWVLRLILHILQILSSILAHFNWIGWMFSIMTTIIQICVDLSVLIFVNLSHVILALNSRSNEIEADKFAHDIGYGMELISGLYLIQKISMNTRVKLIERVKASHPHTADRIASLERLEGQVA